MRFLLLGALFAGGCLIETPQPFLAGQDVHLTVIHTADLHSRFFPYYFAPGQIDKGLGLVPRAGQTTAVVGGIGRVSTVVKCIRGIYTGPECAGLTQPGPKGGPAIAGEPAERTIYVDSGDIFEGAPVFNLFQGEVEMRAMSHLGVTAMALGNHEFDKGAVDLELQYQKFGAFPILAANYMFSDPTDYTQPKLGKLIHDYTITNVGGIKIGVIGLGNLSSIQGIIEGGNSLGVRPIETKDAISNAVAVVRPQVDLLFITSHLGLDEDEGVAAGDAASRDQNQQAVVKGVDAIFGGHLHIVLDPPKDLLLTDKTSGSVIQHTIVCHSGAFAKYVGRLDLVVHMASYLEQQQGILSSVKAYTYRLIPIDDNIPSDPVMDNLLEPYLIKMNSFLNLGQVYALVPCPTNAASCPKTARNDADGGDSQLGNLVASAMRLRKRVEADFALTNSLGIRADFESGPLDLEQMYNVFPFDNTITTMFLSGDEVQQMLDFVAARSGERGCRTQAQVSGIYFDLICNKGDMRCKRLCNNPSDPTCVPPSCADNIYFGDACRKADGTMDAARCRPLSKFAEYRVAVNDYIAQGGSGFAVLKRNTTKFNTGISLRDALVDYIRTLPTYLQDRHAPDVRSGARHAICDPADHTNLQGVTCSDAKGERYDCTSTCCAADPQAGKSCATSDDCGAAACTGTCGPGPNANDPCEGDDECAGARCLMRACSSGCSNRSDMFKTCKDTRARPTLYRYTATACLNQFVQAHDGRIRTVVGGP